MFQRIFAANEKFNYKFQMLYKYIESANKILNSKLYATEDLT